MSILVVGGAGYIGSQISFMLSDNNIEHTVIDNLSTGNKKLINPKASFFKVDYGNKKQVVKILRKKKIDCIIHLAASISVPESMRNPVKYYDNNVINLINLLEAVEETKVKFFLFSSTASVFGDVKKIVSENDFKSPNNVYGKTKYIGEDLIKYSAKNTNLNYAILRYFNVVGADEKNRTGPILNQGHLFANILEGMRAKKFSINVYGKNFKTKDGTGVRDYIDVQDIAQIHIDTLKYLKKTKKSYEFNCGNSKGYSVLEIIKNFESVAKKKFKVKFKKKRPGDVAKIISDNKLIKKKLKIKFRKTIKDSIQNAINWKMKLNKNDFC